MCEREPAMSGWGLYVVAATAWLTVAATMLGAGLGHTARAQPLASADSASLPAPELFDVAWNDFADFHPDLSPAFIAEAESHAAAPIYHLAYAIETPTELTATLELRVINHAAEAWPELWFHLFPQLLGGRLDVHEVSVADAEVVAETRRDGALLRVGLPEPLAPGAGVVVTMEFTVSVPTQSQRNYSLLSWRNGILSLAHAYPILAVYRDDSGWDFDERAPHGDLLFAAASWFRVRLDAPASWQLVASGAETEAKRDGSGTESRRVWTVRAGPVRDLYLSLAEYDTLQATVGGVVVRSHFVAGDRAGAAAALDQAVHALEIFSERWTPYPYRSFDMVPLTTQALGVEFPGVIALSDRLYDGSRLLESTVVHEVAHQWFYGLVGNDQVSDPWLDEALAQHAVWVYARQRYGAAEAAAVLRSFEQRWRRTDADASIGRPVAAYTPAEYGSVVYGRGPLVIQRIVEAFGADPVEGAPGNSTPGSGSGGTEAFDDFLRGYVASFRWRNAEPEAFLVRAEAACGCSLRDAVGTALQTEWPMD